MIVPGRVVFYTRATFQDGWLALFSSLPNWFFLANVFFLGLFADFGLFLLLYNIIKFRVRYFQFYV